MKFGFAGNGGHTHANVPTFIQSIQSFATSLPLFNDFVTVLIIQMYRRPNLTLPLNRGARQKTPDPKDTRHFLPG